jgi:hypothetical protein
VNIAARQLCHASIFLLGLLLILGGILARTEGACIIGMIVAAVNFQQWQK